MNPPDTNSPGDLERAWEHRLHAELRRLPEHEAPASLIPNVMAAVRAREAMGTRAWWQRPATTWHPALRVGFGVAALAAFGAIIVGARLLWPEVTGSSAAQAATLLGVKLSALLSAIGTVVEVLTTAVASVLTPTRAAILAAIVLSQVAVLGLGSSALRALLRTSASDA